MFFVASLDFFPRGMYAGTRSSERWSDMQVWEGYCSVGLLQVGINMV